MTEADTLTLINELQSKIDKLPTKGTLKALEFRLDAILQANLDTFWLLICFYVEVQQVHLHCTFAKNIYL